MSHILRVGGSDAPLGGKGRALVELQGAGFPVPAWFAVAPGAAREVRDSPGSADEPGTVAARALAVAPDALPALRDAVRQLAPDGAPVAVRSSAGDEDGVQHSFAGQFESHLYVPPEDVAARVADVWHSARDERVATYRRERSLSAPAGLPTVIVQRMVNADVAGVAFSADPVTGRRGICVVAATYGLGSSVVSGEHDADSYHVDRAGRVVAREIARKSIAHRRAPDGRGVVEVPVPSDDAVRPALTDRQVADVAALARAAARHFGVPQDIEWAIENGALFLLQSRPITSLSALPDPDGALAVWDNSNITESYGGITTPLTYSFARYVYEEVYRQFCRMVGVPERRLAEQGDALRVMIGLIRGRVYYNLLSWYRVLALLPGYSLNRAFMEQMMGVRDGLPEEIAASLSPPSTGDKVRDGLVLARSLAALLVQYARLPRSIERFHARLDDALSLGGTELADLRADELAAHYRELEAKLLRRWDAPLLNDFFAMIFYGTLRKLSASWCDDTHGSLQNDLVSGGGDVISAEPAKRIRAMAHVVARDPALTDLLCDGARAQIAAALPHHPEVNTAYRDYVEKFGDRCLEELKLETETLADDPLLLFRAVGRLARAGPQPAAAPVDFRGDAERRVRIALRRRPVRRWIFGFVLRHARARVRDRENLRFERTRVFGRVRRIFVELGRRFTAAGLLDDPRDVFHLEVNEVLGTVDGTATSTDLRALSAARKREFARYADLPAPADRFETRGMVHEGNRFEAATPAPAALGDAPAQGADADLRRGIGCYPGVVRGVVRVVHDPREAVLGPGEILVAERTDPGWVMLFPAASGLLVERGSLLSHSAIVARELGLPAIVSIPGLTQWLRTGESVEMDGRTGEVRRLPSPEAPGGQ